MAVRDAVKSKYAILSKFGILMIAAILFIPLIPRIIVPLFTRIAKKKSDYHHEGYIELETNVLTMRTVMSRAFF